MKAKKTVKKYQMGGMALPAQASARAGQALAARKTLPTQAAGARPFKKGGAADKMGRAVARKTADVRGRAMKKGK